MNNDRDQGEAIGLFPIEDIIESHYKEEAYKWADYFENLRLTGNKTRENRSEEEKIKDLKAIELLHRLEKGGDPALAYGFMLFNQTGICKQYWSKLCGKKRKNKRSFFDKEKYFDWLTNIYLFLIGKHEHFKNILYYYKPNGVDKKGRSCGNFDVINSFRVYWNYYFLPILAQYLFKQEVDTYQANTVSIEGASEGLDAGRRLEGELAKSIKQIDPIQSVIFEELEDVLRDFTKKPWSDPIAPDLKSGTTSYLDVIREIVKGEISSLADLRRTLNLSQSVSERVIIKIKGHFEKNSLSLKDLTDYLSSYALIAQKILSGDIHATFKAE